MNKGILLVLLWGSLSGGVLRAGSVSLAWDPSVSADVAGYRLYQGGVTQTYTNVIDIGNFTNTGVAGLIQGGTYFFAVTAYDVIGLESVFSNEISYTVPTPAGAQLQISYNAGSPIAITATGPAGAGYNILTSPDLTNWTVAGTFTLDATGLFIYTDPALPANGNSLFYQLQQISPIGGTTLLSTHGAQSAASR